MFVPEAGELPRRCSSSDFGRVISPGELPSVHVTCREGLVGLVSPRLVLGLV